MSRLLKLWCFTIAELIMVFFVVLLAGFLLVRDMSCIYWILTLPIYSLIGLVLRYFLTDRKLLQIVIGLPLCLIVLLLTVHSLQLSSVVATGFTIVALVIGGFLFFRARNFLERDWSELMPPFIAFYITILNFVILFVVVIVPMLKPLHPIITVTGPAVIFINLLTMNTLNLRTVTEVSEFHSIKNKVAVSKGIGLQNRLLLIVVFLVVLLISLWDKLIDVFNWVAMWVGKFIVFFLSLFLVRTSTETGKEEVGESIDEPAEIFETVTNPFWEDVLKKVMIGMLVLAAIAFVVFMVYQIIKIIRRLIPLFKEYLQKYGAFDGDTDDYTDTKEKLLDLKDLPGTYLKRAADWLQELLAREPKWEDMTTVEEKVRYLYRRVVIKGMAKGTLFNRAKTPTETVDGLTPAITSEELGMILKAYYNNTRYGGELPTEEEVNALYRKLSV